MRPILPARGSVVTTASLQIEVEPTPQDIRVLEDRLYDENVERTGLADGKWLSIFVRDDKGEIVAGLHGWTWGGCCRVQDLWVRHDLRRQGQGTRLLEAAEREAVARGCDRVFLDTFSFQAPLFYQKLGYEIIGALDGFMPPHQLYHLRKWLGNSARYSAEAGSDVVWDDAMVPPAERAAMKIIGVPSIKREQILDITPQVQEFVAKSGHASGLVAVYCPHTTAGLSVNENADPDVKDDMLVSLKTLIPRSPEFKHAEGNADAHIKSVVIGFSQVFMVEDGKILLCHWQQIYLMEFDGPRDREVWLKFIAG